MIKKVLHRIARIMFGRSGIYGKIGHGNKIGKNVSIHEMASIGDYNYIGQDSMIFNAKIGNYNSIAPGVKIGQVEHDLKCVSTSTRIFGPKHGITDFNGILSPAIISNDVWIGANVVVLQGVHVGNGAVIAAGAVVTKDVLPFGIVGGVPARLIRFRFDKDAIQKIETSKWWENKEKEAIKICKILQEEINQ